MKVKYIGQSFGVDSLTNGMIYECETDAFSGGLRVIDDSGEDYLYSPINPRPLDGSSSGGKWEIVEDDAKGSLAKMIYGKKPQKSKKSGTSIAIAGK